MLKPPSGDSHLEGGFNIEEDEYMDGMIGVEDLNASHINNSVSLSHRNQNSSRRDHLFTPESRVSSSRVTMRSQRRFTKNLSISQTKVIDKIYEKYN